MATRWSFWPVSGRGGFAIASGSGLRDGLSGQPLGSDFLSFWSAARLALKGDPESAYDQDLLHTVQQSVMLKPTVVVTRAQAEYDADPELQAFLTRAAHSGRVRRTRKRRGG